MSSDSAEAASATEPVDAALDPRDRRWALLVACGVMAVTLLPYLFGALLAGANASRGWFSWLGFNLDDGCVYHSWMRQAADGHLFQRNLFTTDPQSGHQINLFFLSLGTLARVTHAPLLLMWHLARTVLGLGLLRSVWWLLEQVLVNRGARKTAFMLVATSAGLGWIPGLWMETGHQAPVDVWQPEAITFLCLYLNPLFIAGQLLMVGMIGWLLVAERSKSLRPALYAGGCGFLLGNIHPYDVLTVAAVWAAYLLARAIGTRRLDSQFWRGPLLAALPTAVSTGYVAYLLRTESVFARRAAVLTESAPPGMVFLGYGLVLVLALGAAWQFVRWRAYTRDVPALSDSRAAILLVAWAAANLSIPYAPVSFQRKMLMGAHIPLAILAGVALWTVLRGRPYRGLAVAGAAMLLCLSNVRFLVRDARGFQSNGTVSGQRPYLYTGEIKALDWIRDHTPAEAIVQPLPWIARVGERKLALEDTTLALFTPGLTGHPVNAGHWGETPDFGTTMGNWRQFILPDTTDSWRQELLRQTGVRYLVFSQKHDDGGDPNLLNFFRSPPPYLRLVSEASGEDADVYAVQL